MEKSFAAASLFEVAGFHHFLHAIGRSLSLMGHETWFLWWGQETLKGQLPRFSSCFGILCVMDIFPFWVILWEKLAKCPLDRHKISFKVQCFVDYAKVCNLLVMTLLWELMLSYVPYVHWQSHRHSRRQGAISETGLWKALRPVSKSLQGGSVQQHKEDKM